MIETIKEKWNEIINYLKNEFDLTEVSFTTWILPIKPEYFDRGDSDELRLHLIVPEAQFVKYVTNKYSPLFNVAIAEITGISCNVIFEEENKNIARNVSSRNEPILNTDNEERIIKAHLNSKYTFDDFVVGKNNNLAHAAAVAVAETPGLIYNPLFIYGGVGLGKTHLMQAVGNFMIKQDKDAKVLYVTSESFTNELIETIRNRNSTSALDFRNKYRTIDALLIDDIQFIIGKESTQEEFFHTFNSLYESKKQIIITSDKPPKEFETLEERLRSRFECGLQVDIQSPDYETRMAILRKKEEKDGYNIDNSVLQYIATNVKSNIRELEGALTRVVATAKITNSEVNLDVAQSALRDMIAPNSPLKITPEFIIKMVAEHYGLSENDLIGQKRTKDIAYPRQIAMYLCQSMTDASLIQIGKELGGRDHTTVMHGSRKIADDSTKSSELSHTIEVIKKKIYPH